MPTTPPAPTAKKKQYASSITTPITFRIFIEQSDKLSELRTRHGLSPSVLMRALLDMYFDSAITGVDERIAAEIKRTDSVLTEKKANFGIPVEESETSAKLTS